MKEIKTFSNEDRYAIGNRIADLRETKGYKSMEIAQFMDLRIPKAATMDTIHTVRNGLQNIWQAGSAGVQSWKRPELRV